MEIKEVWFDLEKVERKGKTTFHIDSEKFDKPISLKVGYEDKEKEEIIQIKKDVLSRISEHEAYVEKLKKDIKDLENTTKAYDITLCRYEDAIDEYEKKLEEKDKEIGNLYKVIGDIKTSQETMSGTIIHQGDRISEISKKLTKQPRVYSDKTFVSGHETVALGVLDIPSGDYVVISKHVVGEHNEFVENQDDIIFEKTHVSDGYMPQYKLIGGTALDTPTATIYWDLVFIPC